MTADRIVVTLFLVCVSIAVGPLPASGRAVRVPAGASLQAALDSARPGDVITLDAGAEYRGPFRLPRKDGNGWITPDEVR